MDHIPYDRATAERERLAADVSDRVLDIQEAVDEATWDRMHAPLGDVAHWLARQKVNPNVTPEELWPIDELERGLDGITAIADSQAVTLLVTAIRERVAQSGNAVR